VIPYDASMASASFSAGMITVTVHKVFRSSACPGPGAMVGEGRSWVPSQWLITLMDSPLSLFFMRYTHAWLP